MYVFQYKRRLVTYDHWLEPPWMRIADLGRARPWAEPPTWSVSERCARSQAPIRLRRLKGFQYDKKTGLIIPDIDTDIGLM